MKKILPVLLFTIILFENAVAQHFVLPDSYGKWDINPNSKEIIRKNKIKTEEVYFIRYKNHKNKISDSVLLNEYTYDSLGNIISERFDNTVYSYDAQNRLSQIHSLHADIWMYDDINDGSRTEIRKRNLENDSLADTIKYWYNDKKQLVKVETKANKGFTLINRVIQDTLKLFSKANKANSSICNYSYNKDGKIEAIVYSNKQGEVIASWLYQYKYKKRGIKLIAYYTDNKKQITVRSFDCIYNLQDQCVQFYHYGQMGCVEEYLYNPDRTCKDQLCRKKGESVHFLFRRYYQKSN